ncbi:FecCD family ABC transporter permease [Thermohalobacter berrensis]|nr:iron ABC transporter permease [Thermohalobacter berrensis]
MLLSTLLGSTKLNIINLLKILFQDIKSSESFIIKYLRLPRIFTAFLIGASLAVSGTILQGISRNPLAAPNIVGITGGASLGSVIFITFFSGVLSIKYLPLFSIIGALTVTTLVCLFSWKNGVKPIRLILIGVGVSAAMHAITTVLIILSPIYSASQAYIWLTGSIYGTNWDDFSLLLPWTLFFTALSLLYSKHINLQSLGDEVAIGLGNKVQLHRFILLFISIALAGSAVSIGGKISFIGLIGPHISRRLVGTSYESLIPTSAFIGGLILLIADTVARTAFLPLDIPAGIFTSAIGGPFFIYLLYSKSRK